MTRLASLALAALLFAGAAAAQSVSSANIVYLSGLAPVGIVSDSDTTFWCDNAAGCGPGVDLKRISAPQISNYVFGKINTLSPLSFGGGAFFLNFDSTLSVVGNQLHVVGGGGGSGFPFTLGTTPISASATVSLVSGLTLSGPSMASIPSGTPVSCLALDVSGRVIAVPAISGSCTGSTPSTHLLLINAGGSLLLNAGGSVLLNAS
jgi:hypothetical protein